ncbi:MAG TPA: Hsp20/alpha crystallin family protein [Bacteroidales bacterium]|nr:Hsp20/alpha crystallin family protein [Bacteroidales bacterium]
MLPILRSSRTNLPGLIDDFFGRDLMQNFFDIQTGINTPAVNVIETNNNFCIEVAAPGLEKKDFKVEIENNVLVISSEKEESNEDRKDDRYMRREFSYTSFKRSFALPGSVEADKIKATHRNGILQIEIPKKEEARHKPPRNIEVA